MSVKYYITSLVTTTSSITKHTETVSFSSVILAFFFLKFFFHSFFFEPILFASWSLSLLFFQIFIFPTNLSCESNRLLERILNTLK